MTAMAGAGAPQTFATDETATGRPFHCTLFTLSTMRDDHEHQL